MLTKGPAQEKKKLLLMMHELQLYAATGMGHTYPVFTQI